MNNLEQRMAELSPEKRRLLELLLQPVAANGAGPGEYLGPGNQTEQELARIWESVLGRPQIGVTENFFELGGDSIQAIQIVAKARQAGLRINTNLLFANPTIRDLALQAVAAAPSQAEQGALQGPAPLSPIQHWFFDLGLRHAGHWTEAVLLDCSPEITPEVLEPAMAHLIAHHDSLRLRYSSNDGEIRQEYASIPPRVPLEIIPTGSPEPAPLDADGVQHCFALDAGLLVRFCWHDRGPNRPAQLLILTHHLAIDGISFRILLEDLSTACGALLRNAPVTLPPKTHSFRDWVRAVQKLANDESLRQERLYWLAEQSAPAAHLPLDRPTGVNTEASAREFRCEFSADQTSQLLRRHGAAINSVLLTALSVTLAEWSGSRVVRVDVEGHGREDISEALDVSRTIGWFTTLFPVRIDLSSAVELPEVLRAVQQKMAGIPRRGLGYGLLRYLADERRLPAPQQPSTVVFNYLGQFDHVLQHAAMFHVAAGSMASVAAPENLRPYVLQVVGRIMDGRLGFRWVYSSNLHSETTIERMAARFQSALEQVLRLPEWDTAGAGLSSRETEKILEFYAE